jgi:phenol 2-monooxygenase
MQFHVDDTTLGDPPPLPGQVDVLIIGSGPTGLTLAAQLSAFPGITTRIVEQRSGPLRLGQADGIACRTMEMFEAFRFSERVLRESYWVNETAFWSPDESRSENLIRKRVIQDVEDGLSEFPHVILNQARVHDFYLDLVREAPAPLVPDYSRRLVDLKIDASLAHSLTAYPITACFERVDGENEPTLETVAARYAVGCDGARSAVRALLGRPLRGESARQVWGVMDVRAVTDFPDIRRKAVIHSAEEGSMLIIPREDGYLVRFYIELDKLADDERVADLRVTPDRLIAAAQRILKPYSLEVKEIEWWSVYEIGQRLCDRFDDLVEGTGADRFPRAFIAGDACHTHSAKAGQGMNVSMQDSFNLGWKLAAVLLGRAAPLLLHTYSAERRAVAEELIDFDHKFARMFSARPKGSAAAGDGGIDTAEFHDYFVRQGRFTAGVATHYRPSAITGDATHQELAKGFHIGMRFHSAPVIRMADAKPVELGHTVRADGRWRLFAFADADVLTAHSSRLCALCEFLESSADSPVRRHTPAGEDIDAVIEVIAVCQQAHRDLSVEGLPSLLLPRKGRLGLIDYEKVYCPDLKRRADIFDMRGIDRDLGALIVVRPDQYVGHVLPLDAREELGRYFRGFMLPASRAR